MANRHKQNATASALALLNGITFSEAYLQCIEMGWKTAYAKIAASGKIYLPQHKQWIMTDQKELWTE